MKTGNVILAIFLWLCIPGSFAFGLIFGMFGGGAICAIGAPLIFFILGLVALMTGMEKTVGISTPKKSIQPTHIEQSLKEHIEIKKKFCYNCGVEVNEFSNYCYQCGTKLR